MVRRSGLVSEGSVKESTTLKPLPLDAAQSQSIELAPDLRMVEVWNCCDLIREGLIGSF